MTIVNASTRQNGRDLRASEEAGDQRCQDEPNDVQHHTAGDDRPMSRVSRSFDVVLPIDQGRVKPNSCKNTNELIARVAILIRPKYSGASSRGSSRLTRKLKPWPISAAPPSQNRPVDTLRRRVMRCRSEAFGGKLSIVNCQLSMANFQSASVLELTIDNSQLTIFSGQDLRPTRIKSRPKKDGRRCVSAS